jgi:AraC-like DNA-binding protein
MASAPRRAGDSTSVACYVAIIRSSGDERVRVEMIRFRRGTRLEEHAHSWACVHWIRSGMYKERDPFMTHRCGSGAVLYKPPALVHENVFDEDDAWCVRVQVPWEVLPEPARASRSMYMLTPVARPLLAALWAEHLIADGPSELAAAALTNEIVNRIVGCDSVPGSMSVRAAEGARRAIADRWNETISFSELADQAGVNRATLARAFHRRFGASMGAFQRRLRVGRALRMLDEGASLGFVAHQTGFADQAHFTRAFKAVVGVPPALWRLCSQPPLSARLR